MQLGLIRNTVSLQFHQKAWAEEAEKTVKILREILGASAVDIQHVGSTSVKNIHAKPIIDICAGVKELRNIEAYICPMKENGFIYRGEDVFGQRLFVKGYIERNLITHHIHRKMGQLRMEELH